MNGRPTPLHSAVYDPRLVFDAVTATPTLLGTGTYESFLLIDGQTLSPGSAIVVSGTNYSLPSSAGTELYGNGRATVLPSNKRGKSARVRSTTAFETSPAPGGSGDRGGPSGQAANTAGSVDETGVVSGWPV